MSPTAIVHATTSGGTHAGLLVGRAITGRDVRIVGVDAAAMYPDLGGAHLDLACHAAALVGVDLPLTPADV